VNARRDEGLSLVEVLMAVVLFGLAVAAVLPALLGSVRGSGLQDRFAGARRWVVSAADYTVSSGLPRVACATPSSYQSSVRTNAQTHRPDGWANSQLTITQVVYWNGTAFTSTCSESASLSLKLQQITLQVVDPEGRIVETLDVVKSDG
jgi:prepilin-type N-terminal cleavage/methylation domain-containing protein